MVRSLQRGPQVYSQPPRRLAAVLVQQTVLTQLQTAEMVALVAVERGAHRAELGQAALETRQAHHHHKEVTEAALRLAAVVVAEQVAEGALAVWVAMALALAVVLWVALVVLALPRPLQAHPFFELVVVAVAAQLALLAVTVGAALVVTAAGVLLRGPQTLAAVAAELRELARMVARGLSSSNTLMGSPSPIPAAV